MAGVGFYTSHGNSCQWLTSIGEIRPKREQGQIWRAERGSKGGQEEKHVSHSRAQLAPHGT